MRFETKAVHSGAATDDETGAITPPIHLSTTFERRAEDGDPVHGFSYIRDGNPTQQRLEEALAAIDSASHALAFASGMAAVTAVLQSLPPGSHIILPDDGYYGVRALAAEYLPRWGVTCDLMAMDDVDAVRAAIRSSTRAIWCETPSNPLMKIVDVAALARIAHDAGAVLIADVTFATPALQRPIEHQVPRRTQRRPGRLPRVCKKGRVQRRRPALPQNHRRRRFALQLLARPAGHPFAAGAYARALRERHGAGARAGVASAR
jgi:cystathionine gamma-synthase